MVIERGTVYWFLLRSAAAWDHLGPRVGIGTFRQDGSMRHLNQKTLKLGEW